MTIKGVKLNAKSTEKSKRKEILKAIKEKELAEFKQNLPMPGDKFIQLFELLDAELHARGAITT